VRYENKKLNDLFRYISFYKFDQCD